MAAGSGTASYNPPPPPSPPSPSVAFLSVGEMVLSTAARTKHPREFWIQLYEAGVIDRNQLLPLAEAYFTNNAAPPTILLLDDE